MAKKYGPTEKAKNNRIRVYLPKERKYVGVGGKVKVKRNPPKKSEVVAEATQAQYKDLLENRGFVDYVTDDYKGKESASSEVSGTEETSNEDDK